MPVRWRLGVLAIQLGLLGAATHRVTGAPFSAETWFLAGLLAVVVNPQLLEPYYARPGDVIANALVYFFLFMTASKTATGPGWTALTSLVVVVLVAALVALVAGAGREEGPLLSLGRAGRYLSQFGSARLIYSGVFFLSLIEFDRTFSADFWTLTVAWTLIMALGYINWQSVFSMVTGSAPTARVEGMIGPSTILVSAPDIPSVGSVVSVSGANESEDGVILNRIRRANDVWAQIYLPGSELCERILESQTVTVKLAESTEHVNEGIVGSVDSGSTDHELRFTAVRPLEVGTVVSVPIPGTDTHVIYQLSSARIDCLDVRGGSHLVVRAHANQLGVYDMTAGRLTSHRWVPAPGQPVIIGASLPPGIDDEESGDRILLGYVIGTRIPIFLDASAACDGHIAVQGMTKMGKSSFAERVAKRLAQTRRVTVLDQTGEYVCKKGLTKCDVDVDWTQPGISVFEPEVGKVPAERALAFFEYIIKQAVEEYKTGEPVQRSVIIDEAHQFIPEPAGLGFGAPGRDQSYQIGLLLMQVRKYGISVMLVSQRTAVVAKSALSQCENLIAFRSVDQTGLDYLQAIAGSDVKSFLPRLNQGEAIVFGPAISSDEPVGIVVARESK